MAEHKFKVGQLVRFKGYAPIWVITKQTWRRQWGFTIVHYDRHLPFTETAYRLKQLNPDVIRMDNGAKESELESLGLLYELIYG